MGFLQNSNNFRFIFGIFMVCIYVGMAYVFAFINPFQFNHTMAIIIGILLLAYGIFRGIRLWKQGF